MFCNKVCVYKPDFYSSPQYPVLHQDLPPSRPAPMSSPLCWYQLPRHRFRPWRHGPRPRMWRCLVPLALGALTHGVTWCTVCGFGFLDKQGILSGSDVLILNPSRIRIWLFQEADFHVYSRNPLQYKVQTRWHFLLNALSGEAEVEFSFEGVCHLFTPKTWDLQQNQ